METVIDFLLTFNKKMHENPEQTRIELNTVEQYVAEAIWRRDITGPQEIKTLLEEETYDEPYEDIKSYLLGKAHAITEIIGYSEIPQELDSIIKTLTINERDTIYFIGVSHEVSPSLIKRKLNLTKQYTSNILRKLRQKELLYVLQLGKNRWYSLSPLGRRVLEDLKSGKQFDDSTRFFFDTGKNSSKQMTNSEIVSIQNEKILDTVRFAANDSVQGKETYDVESSRGSFRKSKLIPLVSG